MVDHAEANIGEADLLALMDGGKRWWRSGRAIGVFWVAAFIVSPELFLPDELRIREHPLARLDPTLLHREQATRRAPRFRFRHSRTGVRAAWPAAAVGPGAGRASCAPTRAPLLGLPVAERTK